MIPQFETNELSLLSIKEASKQLKVGKKRIFDIIEKGEIGFIKFKNGTIKIPQIELMLWVQERILYNGIKQSPKNGVITRQIASVNAQSVINKIIRRNCPNE